MSGTWAVKKYFIKTVKVVGWSTLSVLVALLLFILCLQIPYVQNSLVQKTVGFLEKKIGTDVTLRRISISFPKQIVLEGIHFVDQKKDTLFSAGTLSIDTDLWALLQKRIELNTVSLDDWSAFISRSSTDSTFNFEYIIDAFTDTASVELDSTQTPWEFSFEDLEFTRAHIGFRDLLDGNEADVRFKRVAIIAKEVDLENRRLMIKSIDIENSTISIFQTKPVSQASNDDEVPSSPSKPFEIDLQEINLTDVRSEFKNVQSEQIMRLDVGKFILLANKIDLNRRIIDLEKISSHKTFFSFQQTGHRSETKETPEQTTPQSSWSVSLKTLELLDNNFQYYDFGSIATANSIDFDHLWLTQLNVDARNLKYDSNTMQGDLKSVSLRERSGFSISSLSTKFSLTDNALDVEDFLFRSPLSRISLQASARFSSLTHLKKNYSDAEVKLALDPSYVSVKDILYFDARLLEGIPLTVPRNARVNIESLVTGKVNDLTIHHINLDALSETRLTANGRIRGLPEKHAMYDISLNELYTSRTDLRTLSPDTLIPKNINFPQEVSIKGKFHGTIYSQNISADLSSDEGFISVVADLDLSRPGKERYSGKLSTKGLQLGNILGRESMGKLELEASVEGSGLTMKNLNSKVDLTVRTFEYSGYRYENFTLNGSLKNYFFSGVAALPDKNLNFNFKGDLDYSGDVALYKFDFNLKNADLKALGLSERPLKIRGKIGVDVATADFRSINGTVDIREVAIYNDETLYAVDSLLFASIDQRGNSKISIRSDIIAGDFEGTINLFDMPDALRNHFNNYFILGDSATKRPSEVQKFSFELQIKNTDLLTEIILPDLEPFVPGKVSGKFDSESKILNLHLDLTRLQYATVSADSIILDVTSDKSSIDYHFSVAKLRMDTLRIEAVSLTGNVANDSLYSKFTVLDSLRKDKYVLGGAFNRNKSGLKFRLLADRVIINYAPWETPADNFLQFSNTGIEAHNFSITNINEKLSLVTERGANTSTSIVFKDLNLRNITNLMEGTILADGLMNGNYTISAKRAFNSELKIEGLDVFNIPWGDLNLIAGRNSNGPYRADLTIKGQYADVRVLGEYRIDSTSTQIDLKTTISTLNLKMIEPLVAGQLKDLDGHINGDISIKGELMAPAILGSVTFKDATFTPLQLNSPFSIADETISLTSEGIQLQDFEIRDKDNNTATLNGAIMTSDYNDFDLNLKLTANDFQVLNTTEDDSELFYGKVNINTNATISGSLLQPRIQMQISLTDESEFTYIVPQSEKGVTEQKGIVLFVDRDSKADPFLAAINPRDTAKSTFRGLDLTANIELSDKETFSIIIDPVTGDKLSVKGNSTLTLEIDPTGDVQLSGRYEITEGTYDLTFYKLVKRNFLITKGSTITWSGEPLLATMDIRASFEVETSPLELVANRQIPPSNQQQINMYRQRLPFLVYLNIKGDLLTPVINFELDMPIDHRNAMAGSIYATIKDINTRESELNKQVFALLILRRFISDNPFDTQGGSDVEETARRSVSKLLTEQLNRLSENIKGIELSFDVKSYEDYSTGEAQGQTEVQLGVSKSLLDDRLVVKVSGNVDIEGNTANQNSLTDYIGDLALEYKLTEDGRFRITGFRNNSYDIISGELIETGAGLIYIKDYTALRELFKANAKEK